MLLWTLGICHGTILSAGAGTIRTTDTVTDTTAPSIGTTGITGDGVGSIHGVTAGAGMTDGILHSHITHGHGAGAGTIHGTTADTTVLTTGLITMAGTDQATVILTTAPTTPAGADATTEAVSTWATPEA